MWGKGSGGERQLHIGGPVAMLSISGVRSSALAALGDATALGHQGSLNLVDSLDSMSNSLLWVG